MKLTDAQVAKALGWKRHRRPGKGKMAWSKPPRMCHLDYWLDLPPFTTSLDAIVGEIERLGLYWKIERASGQGPLLGKLDYSGFVTVKYQHLGDTPAEALCHGLIHYLKESRP